MPLVTHSLKSLLPDRLRSKLFDIKWSMKFLYTDIRDGFSEAHSLPHPVPGSRLRFKVHGTLDRQDYLLVGDRVAADLAKLVTHYDLAPEPNDLVLDFGCGCGRVTTWLHQLWPEPAWFGCDVDGPAIEWCRNNLEFGDFHSNSPRPPLKFGDACFGLVTAVSVFTHFDREMQLEWFEDLHRVLAPGGHLLVTTKGPDSAEHLDADQTTELERRGFFFLDSGAWDHFHPDWYQTAYHTEKFFREELSERFELLDYRESYINDDQDCALLRKRV